MNSSLFSFVRLLLVVLCAIYCLFLSIPCKYNSISPEPREQTVCFSMKYSIIHDVIQLQMIQSWLVHCVSLSLSLILSSNRRSHANVSYLSQPLQSTQCPPGPHRLSNLSWPEYQWHQSFNLWNLELACCMNYINLKSGSVCQLMQKAIANTWLES